MSSQSRSKSKSARKDTEVKKVFITNLDGQKS